MSFNDINFHASVQEIFDRAGNRINPDIGRGVYRSDTGELMAICGPNFTPVQHTEVLKPVINWLDDGGYDIEERNTASERALYDLRGRKGAFVSAKVTDGGAVMRTDIILGDFIHPANAHGYLDQGEDANFFRISLLNSHNGKFAVRANTDYLRLLCYNGMTQPHFSAGAYGKHTQGFNLDGMIAQITNAMSMMDQDAERFGLWAKTKIDVSTAEAFLRKTVAKLPNKANGEPHFSEPLVNKILTRFRQEDQTVWGLFNAVTWWQTHSDFRANADRITATIGREQKVAAMLKSKEWKEIERAI